MAPAPPRRRKAAEPLSGSGVNVAAPVEKKIRVGATSVTTLCLQVQEAQTISSGVNLRVQQAKNAAVAQAQQDGATGNFRIFDSPFGNYLVPVVPTSKELSD
ncbi:uncharacterized protein LOC109950259 isoform X1 [Prunus persica]|uniref:uncharacterized protein LOC109950259 isoform X1 n=1 Tax=Prunus persica TaxID=3760 RepID=UPI0009AB4C2A|nr:uncharacterized protein LOC109950259 isoform X1 [Prunus persica]